MTIRFMPYNPRVGGHYLRQWYRLQKNIHTLDTFEKVQAKILFSSLAELPDEERIFLAHKYYRPSVVKGTTKGRVSDAVVAESLGMSLQKYSTKRVMLESKLGKIIQQYNGVFYDEMATAKKEIGWK